MATYQELNSEYIKLYESELPRATLARWVKEGKVKTTKLDNGHNNYDLESFLKTATSKSCQTQKRAKKANPKDYIGKICGQLLIKRIVPKEEREDKKYNGTIVECDCLQCGSKNNQIRFSYITGNGNYTQQTCGCIRKQKAFQATSRDDLSDDFLQSFDNFDKYLCIHKMFVRTTMIEMLHIPLEEYQNIITKFYYDPQFNAVYNFWQNHSQETNTFYDWAKPSIDHIIPKSKGGTDDLNNIQILTVFENLAKKDLTMQEWNEFKKTSHTTSDYFIENILK